MSNDRSTSNRRSLDTFRDDETSPDVSLRSPSRSLGRKATKLVTPPTTSRKVASALPRCEGAASKKTAPVQVNSFALDCKLSPGTLAVFVHDKAQLAAVRMVIEDQILRGDNEACIQMPAISGLTSLYVGSPHHAELAQKFATANKRGNTSATHEFVTHAGVGHFNWTSDEGVAVLDPHVAKSGHAVSAVLAMAKPDARSATALSRLGQNCNRAGSYAVLFVVCPPSFDSYALEGYFDQCVVAKHCEPDPGALCAFSIEIPGLELFPGLSGGKVMCQIMQTDRGYVHQYLPFIAEELDDRLIHALRAAGYTGTTIADAMGVNKSTVSRRLNAMAPPAEADLPDDWLDRFSDVIHDASVLDDETDEEDEDA